MIPSTPDWQTFDIHASEKVFVTEYTILDSDMNPVLYGGYIKAHSFEEAEVIASLVTEPKITVLGVLGGKVYISKFN